MKRSKCQFIICRKTIIFFSLWQFRFGFDKETDEVRRVTFLVQSILKRNLIAYFYKLALFRLIIDMSMGNANYIYI